MSLLEGIQNIIFDFGGVIINLNYNLTRDAFVRLGLNNFEEHYTQYRQERIFDDFETGRISGTEFFTGLRKISGLECSVEDLKNAWNAMLLDFPDNNRVFLESIKNKYRTFLLSNTNETHLEYYFSRLKEWYGMDNMDPLFEKTFYSCRLGLRKPDTEIFKYVLDDRNLLAEETLFIDDSPQHVEGAGKCGIRAHHLKNGENIIELLGGILK